MDDPPVSDFVESSPGIELHQELGAFEISTGIQRGNYEELMAKHDEFQNHDSKFWEEHSAIDVVKEEYFRPFHNYVTSIYTVIKHSQRIVNKFGDDEFSSNYTERINEQNLGERGEFLRQLRHYTQKRKVPPLGIHLEFLGDEIKFELQIQKDKMLDWDNWNSDALSYLEDLESGIPLSEVIEEFQNESESFHHWFFRYARFFYEDELHETLERIFFVETMKNSMPGPQVETRKKPTLHGYREEEVMRMPSIPKEYTHPYDPTNLLPDT